MCESNYHQVLYIVSSTLKWVNTLNAIKNLSENNPVILGGFLLYVLSTRLVFVNCFFDVCELLLVWKRLGQAASSNCRENFL